MITHFLPANRPIPKTFVAALARAVQSGAQVQVARAKVVHV